MKFEFSQQIVKKPST